MNDDRLLKPVSYADRVIERAEQWGNMVSPNVLEDMLKLLKQARDKGCYDE
jgi:hypothetical protein